MKKSTIILLATTCILMVAPTVQAEFIPIPDAGTTAGLLAIGALGLLAFRRK